MRRTARWVRWRAGTERALTFSVKAIAMLLWFMMFGRFVPPEEEQGRGQEKKSMQEKKAVQVPWPMICNFIVRVIDGPGDTAVVVAKRDCPD